MHANTLLKEGKNNLHTNYYYSSKDFSMIVFMPGELTLRKATYLLVTVAMSVKLSEMSMELTL